MVNVTTLDLLGPLRHWANANDLDMAYGVLLRQHKMSITRELG